MIFFQKKIQMVCTVEGERKRRMDFDIQNSWKSRPDLWATGSQTRTQWTTPTSSMKLKRGTKRGPGPCGIRWRKWNWGNLSFFWGKQSSAARICPPVSKLCPSTHQVGRSGQVQSSEQKPGGFTQNWCLSWVFPFLGAGATVPKGGPPPSVCYL